MAFIRKNRPPQPARNSRIETGSTERTLGDELVDGVEDEVEDEVFIS
jgi:hypothetical protein